MDRTGTNSGSDGDEAGDALRSLMARMRGGDRSAVGEFVLAYAPLIRNRFRQKIGRDLRGYFDSMDLVSTVARRFDKYAASHDVRYESVEELFGLLFKIARASCAEKARVCVRLQRVEGEDSEIAHMLSSRLRGEGRSGKGTIHFDIDDLLARLPKPEDADLTRVWLEGKTFVEIGRIMDIPESTARQRWARLRPTLRRILGEMMEQ